MLDDMMKGRRMIASLDHLQRHAQEGESFPDHIVTDVEMRILHLMTEHNVETSGFLHDKKIFRSVLFDGKFEGCQQVKRRGILDVDNVVILHIKSRPHVAMRSADKLRLFYCKSFDYPLYCPDLTPRYFFAFGPLKKFLVRLRLLCNNEVKTTIRWCLFSQSDELYHTGMSDF
ncbi:hypothetical protein TNCV_1430961 [Trichonephila clavipes]|nr:hypothetical protein TNCV_1430961 [Trichonephila clavipes]